MRYELTWRQYIVAVKAKFCPLPQFDRFRDTHWPAERLDEIADGYPFIGISVGTFDCYLRFLKSRTGKTYRIPSALEWEHLARAGAKSAYPWGEKLEYGDAILPGTFDKEAMIRKFGEASRRPRMDNSGGNTFPVGSLKPNGWGLYDVIGNVGEITTEILPPDPACLANNKDKAQVCEAYGSRGFGGFFVSFSGPSAPFPEPGYNLVTKRGKAPKFGLTIDGYRLVRD